MKSQSPPGTPDGQRFNRKRSFSVIAGILIFVAIFALAASAFQAYVASQAPVDQNGNSSAANIFDRLFATPSN